MIEHFFYVCECLMILLIILFYVIFSVDNLKFVCMCLNVCGTFETEHSVVVWWKIMLGLALAIYKAVISHGQSVIA